MARPITRRIDFGIPVRSSRADAVITVSEAANSNQYLEIGTKSRRYPLKPEFVLTFSAAFPEEMKVSSVNLMEGEKELRPKTSGVQFQMVEMIKTKAEDVKLPRITKISRVECRPPQKVKTTKSSYMSKMPVTRYALDMKYLPYPVISEYVQKLAERHGTAYTNIKLVGVFDPIPLHLAKDLTIDIDRGVLKYFIRKHPIEVESGWRIARVVYGRIRMTDTIVSAVFPVT